MNLILLFILSIINTNISFYEIIYNENKPQKLVWGKDSFKDSIPFETDKIIKLHSDENHLLLQVSCWSPCWYLLILPLNKKDTIKTIQFNLDIDITNNLILGASDNLFFLRIMNYKTGISDSIKTANCNSAINIECIEDFWYSNDSLYIKSYDTLITKKLRKELFYSFW